MKTEIFETFWKFDHFEIFRKFYHFEIFGKFWNLMAFFESFEISWRFWIFWKFLEFWNFLKFLKFWKFVDLKKNENFEILWNFLKFLKFSEIFENFEILTFFWTTLKPRGSREVNSLWLWGTTKKVLLRPISEQQNSLSFNKWILYLMNIHKDILAFYWLRFVMWFYFIFHGMTTKSSKEVIIYHVILHWYRSI